jgi:predicted nucleotidyltransferase
MTEQLRSPITLDDLRTRRDEILALAEKYGAYNVRVFGSVARGEATSDSDVDLLVDQDWSRLSGWGGMEFVIALEDLFQCHVDVTTLDELKPRIRDRVLKEVVPL